MPPRLTADSFLDTLRSKALFVLGSPMSVSRAPGRLDVMGGIADYSGSLVLQRPIAEATFVAVQRIGRTVLEIVSVGRAPYEIAIDRIGSAGSHRLRASHYGESAGALAKAEDPAYKRVGRPGNADRYEDLGTLFTGEAHWASYIAGPLMVLMRERGLQFEGGVRIIVASDVPEGKGVSSSAAVETAVMRALVDAFDLPVSPRDIALLCQRSENLISNAPCGVMDQMACVFGEADALLALLCQPAELQPSVAIPSGLALWGIDSGERHTVGGSDYGGVRTGAFMGLQILRTRGSVASEYLVSVSPGHFDTELAQLLPDEISGAAFLQQFGGTEDKVTTVHPTRVYKVRVPTSHPIHEHHRVTTFRGLLANPDEANRRRLGELMYQSHASYSACGLGSPGTEHIVQLVQREGAGNGLYGARITGGGSGGTVAVLGRRDATDAIERIATAYQTLTGHRPYIFSGSSPGVASFGAHRITV